MGEITKNGNGRVAAKSLRRIAEAALFAAQARRLKTSSGWPLELDNKKSGNGPLAPKGIRRISEAAFFAAQLIWLMTRGAGRWSLDNKKSVGSSSAATSAGSLSSNGGFCHCG
ncbi:hypothetical protein [Planococcus massiliensis]|uniref:hypothetical protein n=1 Tax=Planococcus massiliensis TaxID=1499687 RepID=UPI0006989A17|nr:hypothetical protein [Planococcus massiliensis]